jgi:hypothetical protein
MKKVPEPGKHCDSVEGSQQFGPGALPKEGPVRVPAKPEGSG